MTASGAASRSLLTTIVRVIALVVALLGWLTMAMAVIVAGMGYLLLYASRRLERMALGKE